MKTYIFEAQQGENGPNHGKFLVGRFDSEWDYASLVDTQRGFVSVLASQGHAPDHLLVLDLATCEGAVFSPGGSARHDLEKHAVWVCPMFLPFLEWLYRQDLGQLHVLPRLVNLPDAEFKMYEPRLPGLASPRARGKVAVRNLTKEERDEA